MSDETGGIQQSNVDVTAWEGFMTWLLPDDGSGSGTGVGNANGSGNEKSQSWLDYFIPPTPKSSPFNILPDLPDLPGLPKGWTISGIVIIAAIGLVGLKIAKVV